MKYLRRLSPIKSWISWCVRMSFQKVLNPSKKRSMVTYLQETFEVSEILACTVFDQDRQNQWYDTKRPNIDRPIIDRINIIAEKRSRYRYRRIAALLRSEGYQITEGYSCGTISKESIIFGKMKLYKNPSQNLGENSLDVLKMLVIWILLNTLMIFGHTISCSIKHQTVHLWL